MLTVDWIQTSVNWRNARIEQYDMLTERGYVFDMVRDEFRSPDGLFIVPAWPPSMPECIEKKAKAQLQKKMQANK